MMTEASLALAYAAHGVPVFPCRAAQEITDRFDPETGEQIIYKEKTPLVSSGFKGATKNERVIRILWERNPGAMIGIPTGEQLGAWVLDVDLHKMEDGTVINGFETLEVLEDVNGRLPRTAVARTAGGGEHHYFKYVPGIRNRGRLEAGLDVRGLGGYVIAPGSKTADGREYVWVDWDGDGIPPLPDAPQWLLDLVLPKPTTERAYQPTPSGENTAYVERAVQMELDALASAAAGGRGTQVNRSAFCLGTFVGAGALSRSEAEMRLLEAAYASGVVAKDGEKEIRAKIRRGLDAGIKCPRDIPESTRWDDGTKPINTSTILTKGKKQHPPESPPPPPAEPPPDVTEDEPPEYKLEAVGDLESLTNPGGLLEDLIDWITSSAEQPNRTLAMAAALPFLASLAGARYSTGSRDTRPNIYTVALAESGFGKEHARSQIKRILMSDHGVFSAYSGPARIMSASALREVLEANSSVNCQIDEFGGFVRDITDRKAGGHQRAISTDLRDYYSASSTFFEGAAYRGTPPKRIYNPCLCIHGTSTPDQFWAALSSASAEDGLLPRLILFHVSGEKPPVVKPQNDIRYVPGWLLERLAAVAGIDVAKQRGNLSGKAIKVDGWRENKPTPVEWTPDALSIFASVKDTIDEKEGQVVAEGRPFMRRIVENAIKLAMVAAIGVDPVRPVITEYIFEWAAGVAWTCAATMLNEVGERLADNQREANYKKITSLIRKAGRKGITEGRLFDRCKAIDGWQRKEILEELMRVGQVEIPATDTTKGRPARRLVWVAGAA